MSFSSSLFRNLLRMMSRLGCAGCYRLSSGSISSGQGVGVRARQQGSGVEKSQGVNP